MYVPVNAGCQRRKAFKEMITHNHVDIALGITHVWDRKKDGRCSCLVLGTSLLGKKAGDSEVQPLCPIGGSAETLRPSSLPKVTQLMERDLRIELGSPDTRQGIRCLPYPSINTYSLILSVWNSFHIKQQQGIDRHTMKRWGSPHERSTNRITNLYVSSIVSERALDQTILLIFNLR